MKSTLYYVLDPMCSWCWGFRPIFQELLQRLPEHINVQYVMGGLAPDSDQPMPDKTRDYVQQQWRLVSEKTGAKFNWDFWSHSKPRRSTFPACRAVIATGLQGKEHIPEMIFAIQKAYYLEARNPSDQETLIQLADEINLDVTAFKQALISEETEQLLQKDFEIRRQLNANNFPTLILVTSEGCHLLSSGYETLDNILDRLAKLPA